MFNTPAKLSHVMRAKINTLALRMIKPDVLVPGMIESIRETAEKIQINNRNIAEAELKFVIICVFLIKLKRNPQQKQTE